MRGRGEGKGKEDREVVSRVRLKKQGTDATPVILIKHLSAVSKGGRGKLRMRGRGGRVRWKGRGRGGEVGSTQ